MTDTKRKVDLSEQVIYASYNNLHEGTFSITSAPIHTIILHVLIILFPLCTLRLRNNPFNSQFEADVLEEKFKAEEEKLQQMKVGL